MKDGTESHRGTIEIRELLSFISLFPIRAEPSLVTYYSSSLSALSCGPADCASVTGSELTVPGPRQVLEDGREQSQPQVGLFPSVIFPSDNRVDFMS